MVINETTNKKIANNEKSFPSPLRLLIVSASVIFCAEAFIMFLFPLFPPLPSQAHVLIDSLLLFLIAVPVLYLSLYQPLKKKIVEDQEMEKRLLLFRNLMDQSSDGIFVVDPKTAGFLYANEKACKNQGYQYEELLNITVMDIDSNLSDMASWEKTSMEVQNKGSIVRESENLRKDGSKFPVEMSMKYVEEEDKDYFVAVVRDVTERKRFEETILHQNDLLSRVLDSLPFPFYVINSDNFRIVLANCTAKSLGGDVEQKTCYETTHGRGKPCTGVKHPCPINKIKETREAAFMEHLHRDKNGKEVNLAVSGFPIFTKDGRMRQVIEYVMDITESKVREKELLKKNMELRNTLDKLQKAQEILVRSEKLTSIGTMAAGVAHETLNPINIISTIVQVLQMEELPGEVREDLDEIMTQVQRATKIMNNLRMFSHQKETGFAPVDVHELFDKTASLVEREMNLENILIKREYEENLPIIEADGDKLSQVFLNLLTNAKDAMKGGKDNRITISTRTMEEEVEVRFTDTGPGIPKDIMNRLFEPFFTTKGATEGTGLGLSLVQSIIKENHGGKIRVESKEGKGASFVIDLPVEREFEVRSKE